jgi:hypothetical protein
MLRLTCILSVMLAALAGCGRDAGPSAPPKQPAVSGQPAARRLIHDPPIARLASEQLRALSMECEKYSPDRSARGPYEAAYCEEAIAAWADSPLQIVPVPANKDESTRNSRASPP